MPAKSKKRKLQRAVPVMERTDLSRRLEAFRLAPGRDLSYQALAKLIGGISLETVRQACLSGSRLTVRSIAKIENFLTNIEGAGRAA